MAMVEILLTEAFLAWGAEASESSHSGSGAVWLHLWRRRCMVF